MSFQLKGLLAILLLLAIAAVVIWAPWHHPEREGMPEDVFAEFDGTWHGTFWSYDVNGDSKDSVRRIMTFRSVNADSQVGLIVSFTPFGDTLSRDSVFNVRRGDSLYSIRLLENGQRNLDRGFWADGQIFWRSRDIFGRLRHAYRERVHRDIWETDGFTRTDKGRNLIEYGRALRR